MSVQTRLFVGNLPDKTNEKELRAAFSAFGAITNVDLKKKAADDDRRNFAFVTLSSTPEFVDTCVKHFSHNNFKGQRLYVSLARESFLERLQRERQAEEQAKIDKEAKKNEKPPTEEPIIILSEKLNPRKRKVDLNEQTPKKGQKIKGHKKAEKFIVNNETLPGNDVQKSKFTTDQKKEDADKKRMESIKKKRQEFKEKQTIIKTGLLGIDKVQNKKIIFSDDELSSPTRKNANKDIVVNYVKGETNVKKITKKKALLDDIDDSGDEINFDIKKQFEGKKGQKVLDLQSRYTSDKRFALDERFIEDEEQHEDEDKSIDDNENKNIELGVEDEKDKQLNILQDVLGVAIRRPPQDPLNNKKNKSKLGMLRFDPTQPEHAKFLAPVKEKDETTKKSKKKKKDKLDEITQPEPQPDVPKPEVSKDQFYKVSETLKEAIAQPTTFSLRSLFGNTEEEKTENMEQDSGFIPLEKPKEKKVKNPLEPVEKNPFVYDSSDSEDEGKEKVTEVKLEPSPSVVEAKAVWKENLFFSISDHRLKEGLAFFTKTNETEVHKERRGLKSLMKKRIYNKERKNQMFQKKIGGRKKTMKKSYRNK